MSDGFCEFIFYKNGEDFFANCLDLFRKLGFSCINPFFNKYFFHINNSPEPIECSDINEMYSHISSAGRFSLTMWKEKNDIWIDLCKDINFNILKLALDNLTSAQSQNIIDALYFEICGKIETFGLSKILIDKNALLPDKSYDINDEFCFDLFNEYGKYNLKLVKTNNFNLDLKNSIFAPIQENFVYSYDFDKHKDFVMSNIFVYDGRQCT